MLLQNSNSNYLKNGIVDRGQVQKTCTVHEMHSIHIWRGAEFTTLEPIRAFTTLGFALTRLDPIRSDFYTRYNVSTSPLSAFAKSLHIAYHVILPLPYNVGI